MGRFNMQYIYGDILENPPEDTMVILHGCNCFHKMGAGIAKRLVSVYPKILEEDKMTRFADKRKLGTILPITVEKDVIVINCYTQYNYGRGEELINYNAVYWCMVNVKQYLYSLDKPYELRSPKIGCGLAGGDWERVKDIITQIGIDPFIYIL
jgi:O-acetyl-ADP-ribose deacetylase (regulator of RNase III)